jgi:hypothetical protein
MLIDKIKTLRRLHAGEIIADRCHLRCNNTGLWKKDQI